MKLFSKFLCLFSITLTFTIVVIDKVKISNNKDCSKVGEEPKIYQKTKRLEDLDLKKVLDIFKQNTEIEITVIEDRLIADNIKKEISNNFN